MGTLTLADLGQRIREGRDAAGLSQGALAERIGVDRFAISRMERAERSVSTLELLDIAETLDLPYSYFVEERDPAVTSLRGGISEDPEATEQDRFRTEAVLDAHLRAAEMLRDAQFLPTGDCHVKTGTVHTPDDARQLAQEARDAVGITGPVPGIQEVTELFGLYMFVARIPTDGASRSPEEDFGVAVVRDRSDPGRRRATAIHELGHHLLGDAYHVDVGGATQDEREDLVDTFASQFLLPVGDLRSEWERAVEVDTRTFLTRLAADHRVSWRLALRVARDAGVITETEQSSLEQRRPTRADLLAITGREVAEDLRQGSYGPSWTRAVMRACEQHHITRARAEELLDGTHPFDDTPPAPVTVW